MIQDGFSYYVRAEVSFTLQEVDILCMLSESHYDYKCKALSQEGGMLYGWRGVLESAVAAGEAESSVIRPMMFRDLDILCKVLEGTAHLKDGPMYEEATRLTMAVTTVLHRVNAETKKLREAEEEAKPFQGEVTSGDFRQSMKAEAQAARTAWERLGEA